MMCIICGFANLDKSFINVAGMEKYMASNIVDILGIPIGDMPFRYLGVPLSHKKLIVSKCLPLVDKVSD